MAVVKPTQCLNLDKNQQRLFIQFFNDLPEKPPTTVRFFDRTDHYTVHGADARFVARCISKVESIKTMAPDDAAAASELDYLVLSKSTFPVFARDLLLVRKYRVEVFIKQSSKVNDWTLGYKGSPGNLLQFEEVLFANLETMAGSSLMAIQLKGGQQAKQKLVCLAFVDCLEQEFALAEFVDDDNLTELEAFIVLLAPKECLLPSKDNDYADIHKILVRNNVLVTMRKRTDFQGKASDVVDDLNKLLKFGKGQTKNAHTLIGDSNDTALLSLQATIRYLELSGDQSFNGQFKIRQLDLHRFVQMDSAAVAALNIYPKPGTNPNAPAYKYQSLLGLLDRCRTAQGHRLMAQWVVQPLRSVDMINDRLNIVECFIDASNIRAFLHDDYLKRFPDVLVLCKKLQRKKVSLQDIYRLYQVVVRALKVEEMLQELENVTVDTNLGAPLKDLREDFNKFRDMVEQILDMDAIARNEYLIRGAFDDGLKEIKGDMDALEAEMEHVLDSAARLLDLESGSTIKLEYSNHMGFALKVTRKNDSQLRNNKKFTILDTTKAGVRFTNDRLEGLNERYKQAQTTYQEKQQAIVVEVINVTLGYVDSFSVLNAVVAELDCLVAFAVAAVSAPVPYVRPTLQLATESSRVLKLKDLRHPFVELQDNLNYIPNDVDFAQEQRQMYLITGPNMGGKSTYIRSVGCAVAMALMGSFVPCSEAVIPAVDKIFGRVGACDDIGKGLSTFMKEMVETAGILRNATQNSLVIIDELGRGTSTYEGCGLAWAIAEQLANETKAFTLFATHFHEITALAKENEAVKNYYMAAHADESTFTLLYQMREGVTDKSFGIHVAKLVKFPQATIQLAEDTYKQIADHFTEMRDDEAQRVLAELTKALDSVDLDNDAGLKAMVESIETNVRQVENTAFRETLATFGIEL